MNRACAKGRHRWKTWSYASGGSYSYCSRCNAGRPIGSVEFGTPANELDAVGVRARNARFPNDPVPPEETEESE